LHYEYSDREDRRAHIQADVDGGQSRVAWRAPPSIAGNVNVYNGSTLVRYNATANAYVRIGTEDVAPFKDGSGEIADVVDAARENGETTVDEPPAGGAPLPAVPAGDSAAGSVDTDVDSRFEVTYEGTETVADREAYVIDYDAVDASEGIVEQTIWLDTEYFITLKSTQVTQRDDEKRDLQPGGKHGFSFEFLVSRFWFRNPFNGAARSTGQTPP
jgi:outer membrane lipoprotein-sorting protein